MFDMELLSTVAPTVSIAVLFPHTFPTQTHVRMVERVASNAKLGEQGQDRYRVTGYPWFRNRVWSARCTQLL